ncbi:MAG: hypothetical protein N2258_05940 [Brevinematales bacterium]|nr:hypothetical protein [Brevinematales bacterium]
MKWEKIFISGIVLAFSPLYFNLGNFIFHYSLLGFGLILLSFYYKKNLDRLDSLIIVSLLFSIFSGFLNWFQLYYFFIFVFYVFSIIKIYYISKNKIIRILAHFFVISGGILIIFLFFGINGQKNFFTFFYYLYGLYIVLGILIK